MPVSREFLVFLLDQLESLGIISSRSMFGGSGIYCDGRMFALLTSKGRFFVKADDLNRSRFIDAGCEPFTYIVRGNEKVSLSYYAPPETVLDDREALLEWARLGREAAERAGAGTAKKPRSRRKK